MKHLICLATSLLSLACATGQSGHIPLPPQDVEVSSPSVARIYILDSPELSQGLHGVSVEENDLVVGSMKSGEYVCWERNPGDCLIEVTFEDMEPMDGDNVIEMVDVSLVPGEVYFYAVTLEPVWKRPEVRLLTHAQARELLKGLKPVQK
jgi:hypothetical protein